MNQKGVLRRLLSIAALCLLVASAAFAQDVQNSGIDPAYQALTSGNVYVDPTIQGIAQGVLQQAAMQSQGNPHTYIKIALLATLPYGHGSRGQYTSAMHSALNLDRNGLIVVVLTGNGRGVSTATTGLSQDEQTRLAKEYANAIVTNPTSGTAALAQAFAGAINAKDYQSSIGLWVIFFLVVAVVGGLIYSASRRKKKELTRLREPIDALRGNVLSGIEYLDGYIDVLPKNNPDSDTVRSYRQQASGKYENAVKILDRATEASDLYRAQALFDRAQADVQQARRALDRATGGTKNIPGDDAMRPEELPESETEVRAIPEAQRGVSFFSSQPAPLGSLVPVTITINGQSRQVLATPQEADELRQGRMPQVRAFHVGSQYVPWYEYQQYDPYRDYWRYQNAGWDGFASGLIAAEMLDSLMYAPAYMMPYAFATDNAYYQGYQDGQMSDYGQSYDNSGGAGFFGSGDNNTVDTSGGADFFGGGVDNNTADTSGGADFFSDAASYDNSGGSDFGGFDSGGSDFGGGDSGGSDF